MGVLDPVTSTAVTDENNESGSRKIDIEPVVNDESGSGECDILKRAVNLQLPCLTIARLRLLLKNN